MLDFPFCFWFQSARHALLMRSPSGCRGTQMLFFSFLPLVSIREAHTTTAQQSGMQENAKDCFSFLFLVSIREARIATAQHSGMQENRQGLANKIDRAKNARTRIVQSHGSRVCAHAVL